MLCCSSLLLLHQLTTDEDGRYWRLLAPDASYTITVLVDGRKGAEETVTPTTENPSVKYSPYLSFALENSPLEDSTPSGLNTLAYLGLVGLILLVSVTA